MRVLYLELLFRGRVNQETIRRKQILMLVIFRSMNRERVFFDLNFILPLFCMAVQRGPDQAQFLVGD